MLNLSIETIESTNAGNGNNAIEVQLFIIFLELAFNENYLPSDHHINTTNSLRFAYPSK